MNIREYLWSAAGGKYRRALPILSFPAVQELKVTVDQLVHDAELQAKAMEIIVRRTDSLAAVSLMDLSVEAEAFGASVCFHDDEVPAVTSKLIEDEDDAASLAVPGLDRGRIPQTIEAIRRAKARIADRPVLAGMIGPFSLAGRLMDVMEIFYTCFDDPELVHAVLEKTTQFLLSYGAALKDAGADGIIVAEPLAGVLRPDGLWDFSGQYVTRIIEALQTDEFAIVYHNCGSVTNMLEPIFRQGAAAYHFGNAVDMAEVLKQASADALCMGNVDPVSQFVQSTPELPAN